MNRTARHTFVAFTAALLLAPSATLHTIAAEFFIHDRDRVAFLGDSITEGGKYTTYLQAYVLTRHPRWRLTFRNVGWGGDTAWLRNRYKTDETALFAADKATQQKMVNDAVEHGLARDVLPLKPTVVTVSMGMNDSYAGRTEEA
jgi:lysophospholipase L1-like esterase